jgi:integrase/recombinase XerD
MDESKKDMLQQTVSNYLYWMIDRGYSHWTWQRTEGILSRFMAFVAKQTLQWDDIFTLPTLTAFQKVSKDKRTTCIVRGFWQFVFAQGKIDNPFPKQKPKPLLPQVYEDYLSFYAQHILSGDLLTRTRKVLSALHNYLEKHHICLTAIKIYDLDTFIAQYNAPFTLLASRINCSCIRGFLRYLFHQQILPKDLASLLPLPRVYDQAKPPKFLRPLQVQKLFSHLTLSSCKELRANALVRLAYTCGLRPKEMSLISLDNVLFQQGVVEILDRKNKNPLTLPLPEDTIKALAAYIIGARPKVKERAIFLNLQAPFRPISAWKVTEIINGCMQKAHLPSTAYWLRHTYAQNLMESGASIFEMKQMLGHTTIRTTQRYLCIHTKLMRTVLFDETL